MSTLRFLRNYNNYENRIIKHDTAISDYLSYTYYDMNGVNFNPNDSLFTEQVASNTTVYQPDYMLELNDDKDTIISRWFVTGHNRTLTGQYKYRLKRDIIADKYNNVINAPIYIERAMINNVNNPLLYNSEGFSFNQIKKEEQLIQDPTKSAWYILYFKKGLASKTITFNPKAGIEDHTISTTIANSIFGTQGNLYQTSNIVPMVTYCYNSGWSSYQRMYVFDNDHVSFSGGVDAFDVIWFDQGYQTVINQLTSAFTNSYNTLKQNVLDDNNFTQVTTLQKQYLSWDNTLVKDANNKLYRVHVIKNPYSRWKYVTSGNMVNTMKSLINSTTLTRTGDWGDESFAVKYDNIEYSFSYEEVTDPTGFSIDIQWGTKATTDNSDYNIIAIPYNRVPIEIGQDNVYLQQDFSRALINAIMASYTVDSELVDIQLLPYFPIVKGQHWPIENLDATTEYTVVVDNQDSRQGIGIFYVSNANFTFNYSTTTFLTTSSDPIERKIQNETQMVRLCSPNYNGVFEFSVAKNGGVDYLNIDVTLKPYNPYIHINPNFNNLYGQDFNDARGLICGGDFSIPIWSTAWQQYELQNKNYKNIFDRQIQNIDFVQSQERTQTKWNLVGGTIQGGVQGGIAGGMMGGPYGAIAGAVIGTTGSAIGGAIDYSMLIDRQIEQKSYMQDMFKYQLGNIKALPYSLSKVTPLTYNNKIWPFIEIYECTDEEENILFNYLTYQSMTINAIGYIKDYQQGNKTFIKGQLIRIEDLDSACHEAMEIYRELEKGVYI